MNLFSFLSRLRRRLLSQRSAPDRVTPGPGVLRLEERRLLDASFAFDGVAGLNLNDFDLNGGTSELAIGQSGNDLLFDLDGGSWAAAGGHVVDGGIRIDPGDTSLLRVDRSVFEDVGDQLALSVSDSNSSGLNVRFHSDLTLPTSPTVGTFTISAADISVAAEVDAGGQNVTWSGSSIQLQDDVLVGSGALSLNAGAGQISDTDGVTIEVGGRLTLVGSSITVGDEAANVLQAGQLTFQSAGAVQIAEDSSSVLTGSNSAGSLIWSADGSLSSAANSSLTVSGNANLTGDTIDLNLSDGRSLQLGSLQFSATGDVTLQETDGMLLSADSTAAGDIALSAGGDLQAASSVGLSGQQISLSATETAAAAGDVGSAADAFTVDGDALQIQSDGDQFLSIIGQIDVLNLDSEDSSAAFDPAGGPGTITLESGHLLLDAADAADGSLVVADGASIHGSGGIDSLQLASGGLLKVDMAGVTPNSQFDQLEIGGSLNLSGRLQVDLAAFSPSVGDQFLILENDAADAVIGTFDGMAEGHLFAVGDHAFQVSYVGGDGNDVVLTARGVAGLHATVVGNDLQLTGQNATADQITVSDNGTHIIVRDTAGNVLTTDIAGATRSGNSELRFAKTLFSGGIEIDSGSGNDTLTVDFTVGSPDRQIRFDGGAPAVGSGDGLAVIGHAGLTAGYRPDAAVTGNGLISIGGAATGAIVFSGLEPVDISGFQTVSLSLPGGDDVLTLSGGTDFFTGGGQAALRVSGSSGGITFETAAFYNNTNLIINTAAGVDGDDSIQLQSTGNLHGNQNLTITTGSGTDTIQLNGNVEVAGNLTFGSAPVTLLADSLLQGDLVNIGGGITDGAADYTLSLNGTRGVSVAGAITTAHLHAFSTVRASSVTLSETLTTSAGTLTTTVGRLSVDGNSTLGGNLSAATDLDLSGAVTLTSAVTLSSGGSLNLSGGLNGAHNVTFNAAGNTVVSAAVGDATAVGSGTGAAIVIRSSGNTSFEASVATQSGILQQDAAGTVTFKENVVAATGDTASTLLGDVVLDGMIFAAGHDVTFGSVSSDSVQLTTAASTVRSTASNGSVTFLAAVHGPQGLTVGTHGTGDVDFRVSVGALTALQFLDIAAHEVTLTDVTVSGSGLASANAFRVAAAAAVTIGGSLQANSVAARNVSISGSEITILNDLSASGHVLLSSANDIVVAAGTTVTGDADNDGTGTITLTADDASDAAGAGDVRIAGGATLRAAAIAASGQNISLDTTTASVGDVLITAVRSASLIAEVRAAGHVTVSTSAGDLLIRDNVIATNQLTAAAGGGRLWLDGAADLQAASVRLDAGTVLDLDGSLGGGTSVGGAVQIGTILHTATLQIDGAISATGAVTIGSASMTGSISLGLAGSAVSVVADADNSGQEDLVVRSQNSIRQRSTGSLLNSRSGAVQIWSDNSSVELIDVRTNGTSQLAASATFSNSSAGMILRAGTSLTITNADSSTADADIQLIANDGRLLVGQVTAGGGNVYLQAAGAAGGITDGNGNLTNIVAQQIAISASAGVGSSDALEIDTTTFAFQNSGSGHVRITDLAGGLELNSVGLLSSSVNNNGAVELTANRSVVIASNLTAAGDIQIVATESNPALPNFDHVTVTAGNTIQSTGGSVHLQAGDDVRITANVSLHAAGSLSLLAGNNDNDNDGRITLDGTSTAGGTLSLTAIDVTVAGSHTAAGQLTIAAHQNVNLQPTATLQTTTGNIRVTADTVAGANGGQISMSDGSRFMATTGTVQLSADGDIAIANVRSGHGSATAISVTSESGAITDAGDTVSDLQADSGGIQLRAQTGIGSAASLETSAAIVDARSGTGNVQLINSLAAGSTLTALQTGNGSLNFQQSIGNLQLTGAVRSGNPAAGGDIVIGAAEAFTLSSGSNITSASGTGGTLTLANLTANGSVQVGAGDITLSGGGNSTVIGGTLQSAGNINISANDDIIVRGSIVNSNAASNVILQADAGTGGSAGDGHGGVHLDEASAAIDATVISQGGLTISGADLIADGDGFAAGSVNDTHQSLRIDADTVAAGIQIQAAGQMTLQSSATARAGIDAPSIEVNGQVLNTANQTVIVTAAGDVWFDSHANNNDGTITTGGRIELTAAAGRIVDQNANREAALLAAADIALSAATGIGSFNAGVAADATNDIDLSAVRLAAVTATGDLFVSDDAALEIGTVTLGAGTISGLQISGGTANDDLYVAEQGSGPLAVRETISSRSGGDIQLTAVGAAADDLLVIDANVTTAGDGAISIASQGGVTVAASRQISTDEAAVAGDAGAINVSGETGVQLDSASQLKSDAGSITVTGGHATAPVTIAGTAGVRLTGATIQSASGNIEIRGTGGDTGQQNEGVVLQSTAIVQSTSGEVRLVGQGGVGDGSSGIEVHGGSVIESDSGLIDLRGTGGAAGNIGVQIDSSSVIRSVGTGAGAAAVQVTGTGGGTGDGIVLGATGASAGRIQSVDGDVALVGSSTSDAGIRLLQDSSAIATGAAAISLQSTGRLAMSDLSVVRTAGGLLQATATTDVELGSLQSVGGEVQITSSGGAIVDAGDTNVDVLASRAALRSQLGIGTGNAIDSAVSQLAATTETQNLLISNSLATGLQITAVDGLTGVTIVDMANADSGSDLLVQSSGALTLNQAVDNRDGGHVSLIATDMLEIDADVTTNLTGAITVSSTAEGVSLGTTAPTAITSEAGTIVVAAAGHLTVAADVFSSSGQIGLQSTGALTLLGAATTGASIGTAGDIVVSASAIDMQQNTSLQNQGGGGNRISLVSRAGAIAVQQINAGTGSVLIDAETDILDAAANTDHNIVAGRLQLMAGGQIGQADTANAGAATNPLALDTAVSQLSAATSAGLHVQNSTAVTLDHGTAAVVVANGFAVQADGSLTNVTVSESTAAVAGLTSTAGSVKLMAAGDIHVQQSVNAGASGHVLLEARSPASDVHLTGNVMAADGHLTVLASGQVNVGSAGGSAVSVQSSGSGSVFVQASGGDVLMQPDATISSGTGSVVVSADGGVTVGRIRTGGVAAITATTGAIRDADADNSVVDVTADRLRLRSAGTIGHALGVNNSLDLAVHHVAAAAGGFVHLNEADALVVDSVDVTVHRVTFSDGAVTSATGALSGISLPNNDLLLITGGTLHLQQNLNADSGTIRIFSGGTVDQHNDGAIVADTLALRIAATTAGQSVSLGAANNAIRLTAIENLSEGGSVSLFDAADGLQIGRISALHGFARTVGIQANAGDINITSDGHLNVTETIDAAHKSLTASRDEDITLISRNGNFVAAAGVVITADEDPTAGVFDDTTGDSLTIIAGVDSGTGVVELPASVQLRTDGGVARQLAPRPDGFAMLPATVADTAFVTMSDTAGMRSSLTFQNGGFLGILDLIFGLPGEENLEVVIDWGVVSQTSLSAGVAGNASLSATVGGALEFSASDADKNIFYIDEGGQRYRIPHTYAISDLATTPHDRNGREDNPNIIGVRFSVAQHRSINVWGQQITNPVGGANEVPTAFTAAGSVQQVTDASGRVIRLPDAGLALLTSTDSNPLSEFHQQAVEAPIGPTTSTASGTPVGKAEWEFIAGPTPGRVQFEPSERLALSLPQPETRPDVPVATSAVTEVSFEQGVASDSAIGTEVFLQIHRRFERDADAEVMIARIADQSVVATRDRFEEFVRRHPELTDGAGYEIWLVTKTGGQTVEQPIVQFEITAGRPGPAIEELPAQLQTPTLQDVDFEQPSLESADDVDDKDDVSADPQTSTAIPAPSTPSQLPSRQQHAAVELPVSPGAADDASAANRSGADLGQTAAASVLLGSAARLCRRLDRKAPRMTRAATVIRRLAAGAAQPVAPSPEQSSAIDDFDQHAGTPQR